MSINYYWTCVENIIECEVKIYCKLYNSRNQFSNNLIMIITIISLSMISHMYRD